MDTPLDFLELSLGIAELAALDRACKAIPARAQLTIACDTDRMVTEVTRYMHANHPKISFVCYRTPAIPPTAVKE